MQRISHKSSDRQLPSLRRVRSAIRRQGSKRLVFASALVLTLAAVSSLLIPKIYADQLQTQIEQLRTENAVSQTAVDSLLLEAANYEDAIKKLQSQIDIVQQNIAANKAQQTDLKQKIADKQMQLDAKRRTLGDDIKAMYVDGQLSTIEMLATSQNINEFVDRDTYHESVQRSIQSTLNEIAKLQNQLQTQKLQIDQLLAAQATQEDQLSQNRAKQNELLALNAQQRDTYNQRISANQDKIRQLQAQQAALNLQGATRVVLAGNERGGDCDAGNGNGGYRLASGTDGDVCDAPKDKIRDWAGIENRECTSYAYWYFKRVAGNTDFTASGDAKYWVQTSNYPVRDTPRADAIGVLTTGEWGHVVIVQAVGPASYRGVSVPAGKVLTSEMNSDFTGHFSYNLRDVKTMQYIYK